MTTVFVTGASGCIGRQVVLRLAGATDFKVVAGRHETAVDFDASVTIADVDVRSVCGLENAFIGVDVVVHCAAADRAVSVNGSQAVLNAARTAGVKRLIYISCSSVYGMADGLVNELTPPRFDDYTVHGAEKKEVEGLCLNAGADGLAVTVLRSVNVLSPGGLSPWSRTLTRRLHARKWGTIGPAGEGTANIVDARDLAAAVEAVLGQAKTIGRTYNVNGCEQITWNALFDAYNQAMDFQYTREMKLEVIGFRVLGAQSMNLLSRGIPMLKRKADEISIGAPSFEEIDLYRRKVTYSTDTIRQDVGWEAKVPLKQSIADAAAWARDHRIGWLS